MTRVPISIAFEETCGDFLGEWAAPIAAEAHTGQQVVSHSLPPKPSGFTTQFTTQLAKTGSYGTG
jgi:hypothetical protein